MTSIEILLVGALRVIVEVALLALLGQGLLGVLAGSRRDTNVIYRLFLTVTAPAIRLVRVITPKVVLDKHVPLVAFFFLFWLWILLAYVKRQLCLMDGLAC